MPNQLDAQEVQWFQPSDEWYYRVDCMNDPSCGYKHYRVTGDTVIAGYQGVVLSETVLNEGHNPVTTSHALRMYGDTVFRYSPEAEQWHMLYDMGAQPGDVWVLQDEVYLGFEGEEPGVTARFQAYVEAVSMIEVNGIERRYIEFGIPPDVDWPLFTDMEYGPILEGIGPVAGGRGLTGQPTSQVIISHPALFQCFLREGELVYGAADAPCGTLSVADGVNQVPVTLFPNPARDQLFIEMPDAERGVWQLRIVDLQGRRVQEMDTFVAGHISVGHLPAGMYLLHARDGQGRVGAKKFVKGE